MGRDGLRRPLSAHEADPEGTLRGDVAIVGDPRLHVESGKQHAEIKVTHNAPAIRDDIQRDSKLA